MKTPINSNQRKALLLCLAKDYFDIGIFPELSSRMPKTEAWFRFISDVTGDNLPATMPLNRSLKIAALETLRSGFFNLNYFNTIIEQEEQRDRFLELMKMVSIADDEIKL